MCSSIMLRNSAVEVAMTLVTPTTFVLGPVVR